MYDPNAAVLIAGMAWFAALAAWEDLLTKRIPTEFVVGLFVIGMFLNVFTLDVVGWWEHVLALLYIVPFCILWKAGHVGGGDGKMITAMLFTMPGGFPAATIFNIAFWCINGVVSVPYIIRGADAFNRRSTLRLGPILLVAYLLAVGSTFYLSL